MSDVPSWLPARLATLKETFEAHLACMARMARGGFAPPTAILERIEHLELEMLKWKQFMAAAEAASVMAAMAAMAATSATSAMAVADAAVPDDVSEDEAADAAVPDDVSEDAADAEDLSEDEAFEATVALESLSASLPVEVDVEVDWTDFTEMAITVSGRSSAVIADTVADTDNTEGERAVAIAEGKQLAGKIAAAEQYLADMAANAQERREADARMAMIAQQIKAVEGIKTTTVDAGSRSPSPSSPSGSPPRSPTSWKVPKTTKTTTMKKKKRNTYKWA